MKNDKQQPIEAKQFTFDQKDTVMGWAREKGRPYLQGMHPKFGPNKEPILCIRHEQDEPIEVNINDWIVLTDKGLIACTPSDYKSEYKEKPEKGQLTNEEYLDLHGSKDNMYLQARITTIEYCKLPEDKRRFYMRFCGHNEVYYTLNPMTSPFPVTLPKIEDKAPLSNENKVGESEPFKTAEEFIKTIYVNAANFNHIASTETINGSLYTEIKRVMEAYASQFKNTDAVKVITEEIVRLKAVSKKYPRYKSHTNYSINILHSLLTKLQS
jgi:hypothetical protein